MIITNRNGSYNNGVQTSCARSFKNYFFNSLEYLAQILMCDRQSQSLDLNFVRVPTNNILFSSQSQIRS